MYSSSIIASVKEANYQIQILSGLEAGKEGERDGERERHRFLVDSLLLKLCGG